MTYDETDISKGWRPSVRWLLLVPVLLLSGVLSAVLTVANPPAGFAEIRSEIGVPRFIADAPVYDPPEFDSYHVEEQHEMAFGEGEIE